MDKPGKLTARFFIKLSRWKERLYESSRRNLSKIVPSLFTIAAAATLLTVPTFQSIYSEFFSTTENLASLKSLMAGTSSALIGATAITFSLILFAMQVNIERMPHGLFRKLSSDWVLLSTFIGSFIAALTVGIASLAPLPSRAAMVIWISAWCIITILSLFTLAYRRALKLISPTMQLDIMLQQTSTELRRWETRCNRARPIIEEARKKANIEIKNNKDFDDVKFEYLNINPHWDHGARKAVQYAISYAQRFSALGDHEVAASAVRCIMLINATYCSVKNKTFINDTLFFEASNSTDGFINTTLEHFRQMMRVALSNSDERLAIHTLQGIASLAGVYLGIDYANKGIVKKHAGLASGYLQAAVESVLPQNMPDVVMEGIRLMGRTAKAKLDYDGPTATVSLTNKIALISCAGIANPNYRPITLIAFEQISMLTFELIIKSREEINYPIQELRSSITRTTLLMLASPSSPLQCNHRAGLGPYFSSTSTESLLSKLVSLTNELLAVEHDNLHAQFVIANIETWSNQIFLPQKELLLAATNQRSELTFDLIHWAGSVSEALLAIASSPACKEHMKEKLIENATWLINIYSWIPKDAESTRFVENSSLTEVLFDACLQGKKWGSEDYYSATYKLLLQWALRCGQHQECWGSFPKGMRGLAGLTLQEDQPYVIADLKQKIIAELAKPDAPNMDIRQRTAEHMRRFTNEYRVNRMTSSKIDYFLRSLDQPGLNNIILEIAEIIERP